MFQYQREWFFPMPDYDLAKFGRSKRSGIEELLWNKLPDILTDKQKKYKVTNLFTALRNEGKIKNEGYSEWILI